MSFLRTLAALPLLLSTPLALAAGCSSSVASPFSAAGNPGGYALGAPCAFDDQCVTGRCSADPAAGTCGACVTIEALGQDCTGPHQGCSVSAVCKGGVCTSLRKVEGEACALEAKGGDRGECDVELYCEHGAEQYSEGTCARRIPLGESCGDGTLCVVGATCEQGVCEVPVPGACWYGYACGHGYRCGDDILCHPGTLALGEACGIVDGSFIDNDCGPGLVCGNGTCVPGFGQGETCMYWQCADGLFCHVSVESDALSICEAPRAEGEACSNDNVVPIQCAEGLECRGDVCRAACH
jgi:hypothetical protein